ncbi:hypothetical protein FQN54_003767 [Arachnomyces sp. PD_36]|nr:hypothetical protein FQN54_003767 [Arachnomyces sp. PD_36]
MGKGGRIACIFTPYLLTIASLICIILVGMGCTNKDSDLLDGLYFMRADLRDFTPSPDVDLLEGIEIDDALTDAFLNANGKEDLKDFYSVGLWNYCDGDFQDGKFKTKHCSDRKARFWFNPVEIWGLDGTGIDDQFPDELKKGLDIYKKVSGWMFIAYAVAFFATIAELIIGISAIFSRWGSLFTTICSAVSSFFTIGASITASALYGTLVGTFNSALKPYNIHGSMGRNMYVTTWLAVLFSFGAGLFWVFSVCCCSGRSPYNNRDRNNRGHVTAEKTPYTYEPVSYMGASPNPNPYNNSNAYGANAYGQGVNVPMQDMGRTNAYEPFRHERV